MTVGSSISGSAETQQSGLTTFTDQMRSHSSNERRAKQKKGEEELKEADEIDNTPSETSDIDSGEKKSTGSKEEEKKNESEERKLKALVPAKLQKVELITRHEMAIQRKYLNINRWNCVSRPQYQKSCGISSLTCCWNYLFSQMGETSQNRKPILTQDQAL
jgi:hypothetical protein